MKDTEKVLVMKCSEQISKIEKPLIMQSGLTSFAKMMQGLEDLKQIGFLEREKAEKDEEFLQIIPYVVFESGDGSIVSYRRSSKGGEGRLQGKKTIGFGGHINSDDIPDMGNIEKGDFLMSYINGTRREILEECGLKIDRNRIMDSIVGLIHERENEVGRVHIGVVHKIVLSEIEVKIILNHNIEEHEEISIEDIDSIRKSIENNDMEKWSELAMKTLELFDGKSPEIPEIERRRKRLHFALMASQTFGAAVSDMIACSEKESEAYSESEEKMETAIFMLLTFVAFMEFNHDTKEMGFVETIPEVNMEITKILMSIPDQDLRKVSEFVDKVNEKNK